MLRSRGQSLARLSAGLLALGALACGSDTINLLQLPAAADQAGTGGVAASAGASTAGSPPLGGMGGGAGGAPSPGGASGLAGTGAGRAGAGGCAGGGCGGSSEDMGGWAGFGGCPFGNCGECSTDAQCQTGQHCTAYKRCVECEDKTQCKPGYTCEQPFGRCEPTCQSSTQCTGGLVCDPMDEICVQCIGNEQCEKSSDPEARFCYFRRCVECFTDRECPPGEHCDPRSRCVN